MCSSDLEHSVLDRDDPGRAELLNAELEETARAGKRVRTGSEVSWGRPRATGAGDKRPAKDSTFLAGIGGD